MLRVQTDAEIYLTADSNTVSLQIHRTGASVGNEIQLNTIAKPFGVR